MTCGTARIRSEPYGAIFIGPPSGLEKSRASRQPQVSYDGEGNDGNFNVPWMH